MATIRPLHKLFYNCPQSLFDNANIQQESQIQKQKKQKKIAKKLLWNIGQMKQNKLNKEKKNWERKEESIGKEQKKRLKPKKTN